MSKTLDDSQLLRLAADPRVPLFTELRGSTVCNPIALIAVMIPAISVVAVSELNDAAARWALRALDLLSARSVDAWLHPGLNGFGSSLIHQPPLSSWLLAGVASTLGTDACLSWHVVSLVASCALIWCMYWLGRRMGGPMLALVAVGSICCHPVTLRFATGTGPAAIGSLLIVIAVWGFLGHLGGPPRLASWQMLIGAVAWGLSLLAVGPVAVALMLPMGIHVWLLRGHADPSGVTRTSATLWHIWLGLRGFLIFAATGLSFSGWWQIMMLSDHGLEFWNSWWTGLPPTGSMQGDDQPFWRVWLSQNVFLAGLLAIGLFGVIGELRAPSNETTRRACQFGLLWWLTAFTTRLILDIPPLRGSALMAAWDGFLLIPSVLMVAWGVKTVALRQTHSAIEAPLIVTTVGLFAWRISDSVFFAIIACLFGIAILALMPAVTVRVRRFAEGWKERDWRRVMQLALLMMLVGHFSVGFDRPPRFSPDAVALTEIRRRIAPIPKISRISLVTMNGSVPDSLVFLFRSHWPAAQFEVMGAWDGNLAGNDRPGGSVNLPNELVVEWARRDIRIRTEFTADRQATPAGDPVRFRGHKLVAYVIEQQQH